MYIILYLVYYIKYITVIIIFPEYSEKSLKLMNSIFVAISNSYYEGVNANFPLIKSKMCKMNNVICYKNIFEELERTETTRIISTFTYYINYI